MSVYSSIKCKCQKDQQLIYPYSLKLTAMEEIRPDSYVLMQRQYVISYQKIIQRRFD